MLTRLIRKLVQPSPIAARVITVAGEDLPVHIRRHPQSRSMRLRFDPAARAVRITIPTWGTAREAMTLAKAHTDWLARQMERAVVAEPLADGAAVLFMGREVTLWWDAAHSRTPKLANDSLLIGGEATSLPGRVTRWMQSQARAAMADDLAFYCARAAVSAPSLSIGDARSRWGSCSLRGGIRMNWRLIMATPEVRRSVVAHEVAHLRHMDHSPQFYAHLDALFDGDRRACDAWLKANGARLRAFGAV